MMRYLSGAFLTIGILLTDLYIKRLIPGVLALGERIEVISGFFDITYILNPGAAFGLLSKWDSVLRLPLFIVATIFALGFVFYLYVGPLAQMKLPKIALPLIAGGALANFYERLTVGAVVDYLDLYISHYHWPAFNLADASITTGVVLLLVNSLFDPPEVTP